ncbi:MAG: hypothetical protein D6719_05440 [Candidatus Dadabacteria bacterium]|nr:MAG: hypothetical protein D6719_05440 [Candidatus Dadabacteria bacterium]
MVESGGSLRREKGGVLIESLLGILVFLTAILFGTDLIRIAYNAALLKSAVIRAGRWAELGLAESSDLSTTEPGVNSVRKKVIQLSNINVSHDDFSMCEVEKAAPDCSTNTRGDAMRWMYISAKTSLPVFFGYTRIPISAATVIQNEPGFKLTPIEQVSQTELAVKIGGDNKGGKGGNKFTGGMVEIY